MNGVADHQIPCHKFVLTGGPCAGKTTGVSVLSSHFSERGFRVFTVPETATLMFLSGNSINDLETTEAQIVFQREMIKIQCALEDAMVESAKMTKKPSIVLCDRGLMDGRAYVSTEVWEAVLREVNMTEVDCRDRRYDAVFHMVTSADGAAEFYQIENNQTRFESAQEAIDVDRRLQQAWFGHHNHFIFQNRKGEKFERKISRIVDRMSRLVGIPFTEQSHQQYILVAEIDLSSIPVPYCLSTIERYNISHQHSAAGNIDEQDHVASQVCILECRRYSGVASYHVKSLMKLKDGSQIETWRKVDHREINNLIDLENIKCEKETVYRVVFMWERSFFTLEINKKNDRGFGVAYVDGDTSDFKAPEFLSLKSYS